jgi:hypothetical protein
MQAMKDKQTDSLATRFVDLESINRAKEFRANANHLLSELEHGNWDDDSYVQFWRMCDNAGPSLRVSNSQMSELAGLNKSFFTSVSGSGIRAKPDTIRKALGAVITVASERLHDVDALEIAGDGDVYWIPNPHLKNASMIEQTRNLLLQLIEQLHHSNSLHEIPQIDSHFRNSTIELLETVIAMLKAPLIEKSIFGQTVERLKVLSTRLSDHASAGFVGGIAGSASTALLNFLSS